MANYARARAGQTVEVASREVQVMDVQLLAWESPRLRLFVHCGSGTYIRSLVRDLGEALGCGAHVEALRRTWVRPFLAPSMISLSALEAMSEAEREQCLLPMDEGLRHLPAIELDAARWQKLRLGQRVGGVEVESGSYIGWHQGLAVGRFKVDDYGVLAVDRLFNR